MSLTMSYFEFRQGMSERIAKQLMSYGHQRERTASGWEAENSRSYVIDIQRSMNERTHLGWANVRWTFEQVNRLAGGLQELMSGGASLHDQAMNGVKRGPLNLHDQ